MTIQRLTQNEIVLCQCTPSLSSFSFLTSFHAGVKCSIAISCQGTPSLASIYIMVKHDGEMSCQGTPSL